MTLCITGLKKSLKKDYIGLQQLNTEDNQENTNNKVYNMATSLSAIDKNCTFLISNDKSGSIQQEEICKDLESSDVNLKIRYYYLDKDLL